MKGKVALSQNLRRVAVFATAVALASLATTNPQTLGREGQLRTDRAGRVRQFQRVRNRRGSDRAFPR